MPAAELEAETAKLAQRIADAPARTRQMCAGMGRAIEPALAEQLDDEKDAFAANGSTNGFAERLKAFFRQARSATEVPE